MNAISQLKETFTQVCELSFIPDHGGVCALVEGQQVALFRISDEVFACDNYDPFSEAFVMSRGIVGDLKDQLCIASPIYKQHFNLLTGQCLEDETVSIKIWETDVVDGIIYVKH